MKVSTPGYLFWAILLNVIVVFVLVKVILELKKAVNDVNPFRR